MPITHSKATSVESPENGGSATGGVCLREEEDGVKIFQEFPLSEIEAHISSPDAVIGSSDYEIRRGLERLFPCEHKDCSHVRKGKLEISDRRRRRSWRPKETIDAWFIERRPVCTSTDIEILKTVTASVGPVLLPYGAVSRDTLTDEMFVVRDRKNDMLQVNHNPKVVMMRPYREAKKRYAQRTAGELPKELRHLLYSAVHPGNWPNDHDFTGCVSGKELYSRGGWNRQTPVDFDLEEILECLDLTRKLDRKGWGWWRDKNIHGCWGNDFHSALHDSLDYLHGLEARADKMDKDHMASSRAAFDQWIVPELQEEGKDVPTFEEWYGSERKSDPRFGNESGRVTLRRFCRWLRAEARACKIKVPPKPKEPVKPGAKKKKKRKKANVTAKAD
jgi:hypothetical protein